MSRQGSAFSIQEKEIVVKIKHFFDMSKKLQKKKDRSSKSAVALTAEATQFSEISVARIMAEYNKNKTFAPPLPKGSSPHAVDERVKTICRDEIRSHNIKRDHLSLRKLGGILCEKYDIPVARETLRLNLARWGIVYGPVLRHTAQPFQCAVILFFFRSNSNLYVETCGSPWLIFFGGGFLGPRLFFL